MDKDIKEKWVKALRSGEYKQHLGALSSVLDRKCLCCIGVGFAVARDDHIEWSNYDTDMAAAALGLSWTHQKELVRLNDEQRRPFAEIADYIEANL